ncbi:hypothetical protein LF817_18305 [Halobacillus sp. A1]|uniref:hypothetical protein n=1 Tax=Halobacillus sp. A1 TaxID=2880262 RepID=UPI0020A64178|nr:hypothetical protein [Halobacillus sp. A1]MCP3033282.1 hypothetical protein [Halobacillus sp. A1]
MNRKQIEEEIIKKYQQDEQTMVLIFAQWCINHDLDPNKLYQKAYPFQPNNSTLVEAVEHTVPREQSDEISNETLLTVLSLFGNDDLAFVVSEYMNHG